MSTDLGMPQAPPAPLAPRRQSRQIMVGSVPVGGGAPVSVQSMTTTLTANVNATLQQIAELTASGCQIVRVAVPSQDDAEALPAIAKKSQIPVIADIHFQPKYVFAAIEAGCAAVRVNPGNIKQFDDKVAEIARAAGDAGIPIRIGVNAGSLDKRLLAKYGKATPEALVESALWECSLFEEHGFRDIKISVKHHDPVVMINAYRLLARQCDYPLHLGVTEAGPAFQGTVKSAVAFGALLAEGIGDTIRVSLSAPPVEEVKVGISILESLGMRQRGLEIVSCPSCGRAQVDVYKLAEEVTAGLEGMEVPLRVAVMGCVVNGPGEAREADLGVASGNGKGQIFVRGKVIATVPESQIVETLIEEAMRLAEQLTDEGGAVAEDGEGFNIFFILFEEVRHEGDQVLRRLRPDHLVHLAGRDRVRDQGAAARRLRQDHRDALARRGGGPGGRAEVIPPPPRLAADHRALRRLVHAFRAGLPADLRPGARHRHRERQHHPAGHDQLLRGVEHRRS